MQPEFHSGAVTRSLSAVLWLAMMGCPALRARGELAAGACAPVLGWDRGGSYTNDHLARLEGARFTEACAAVTNPQGSPSSPVLLVAQAAAGALHAPEFIKLIIMHV